MIAKTSAFACMASLAVLAPAVNALPFVMGGGMPGMPGSALLPGPPPSALGLKPAMGGPFGGPPHPSAGLVGLSELLEESAPKPEDPLDELLESLMHPPHPHLPHLSDLGMPHPGMPHLSGLGLPHLELPHLEHPHLELPHLELPHPHLNMPHPHLPNLPGLGLSLHPNAFLPKFHFTAPNEEGHIEVPGMDCMGDEDDEDAEKPKLQAFADPTATGKHFAPFQPVTISVSKEGVTIKIPEEMVCMGGPTGGMCLIHLATIKVPSPGHVIVIIKE